jgi:hypothetical protein
MYLISILICAGMACLIANAAYFAIFKSEPAHSNTSNLSPEERLKRAYRSAYFAHVSFVDEVRENAEGNTNDY